MTPGLRRATRRTNVAKKSGEKNVGDVLGIGRSKVKAPVPSKSTGGRRRVKGIELPKTASRAMKRAGTVGGVRGRGR
jgi:hypothetical protein